jgi:hypothetical protein
MSTSELWAWLPVGYLLTICIETPVLLVGLSRKHPYGRKLFAGLWLTACTYPVVVLVFPLLVTSSRFAYLAVAETFAPAAECLLFWLAFRERETVWRDMTTIVVANLASFLAGELHLVPW